MDLQTRVNLPLPKFRLNLENTFCTIGSCFSSHLTNYFQESLLTVYNNPAGITFNPLSISQQLENAINNENTGEEKIIFNDELYHSLDHHGYFSSPSREKLFENIRTAQLKFREGIQKAQILVITMGTAFVFRHKQKNIVVNNCHKMDNDKFARERLKVDQIVDNLSTTFKKCRVLNPNLNILLTVSPIRHIRDGLIQNQRSKSILLLTADKLQQELDFVDYFPAYEIFMDELRDYRFYTSDMIHPTSQSIDYILNSFVTHYFDPSSVKYFKEIDKLLKSINHKPLHPDSANFRKFIIELSEKIDRLQKKYPNIPIVNLKKN